MDPESVTTLPSKAASIVRRVVVGITGVLALYLAAAYLVIPFAWKQYAEHHPAFDDNPQFTETGDGHPGDPLNIALIGSEAEVREIMAAAKWYAADPLGLKSDLEIAAGTVLKRPYDEAPVSSLYIFERKEDLAFEHPMGDDPRKRNHVRFWRTSKVDAVGRPIWVGAASYDERVGLSHTTGQITHHIAPDVDSERDHLFTNLQKTGDLSEMYKVAGFHKVLEGRNGGGDPWHTDGDLWGGMIAIK
jgi:hypothetical protein